MQTVQQLALPFGHRPDYAPGAFVDAPSNAAARNWLARPHDWPDGRLILWGGEGCGKTHLAHLWAAAAAGRRLLDAADTHADEPALLHLLNAAAEANHRVLLTARAPASRWTLFLPDLISRLRAAASVAIDPPEDALLQTLLAHLLAERQLAVATPMQDWLLHRLPRTAAAVQAAVARLDTLSLARGRPITRQLAQAGLADLMADDDTMTLQPGLPLPPSAL